jgi:predicted Zn-dependent protease with MMP-like domain
MAASEDAVAAYRHRDRAAFERIVDRVLDDLPDWVVGEIDNLHVVVQDYPTAHQAESGHNLLGLYEGVTKLDRGNDYFAAAPDRITIFRASHLADARSAEALETQVRKTVLHELGHHLGIDDDRLHEIGWG